MNKVYDDAYKPIATPKVTSIGLNSNRCRSRLGDFPFERATLPSTRHDYVGDIADDRLFPFDLHDRYLFLSKAEHLNFDRIFELDRA